MLFWLDEGICGPIVTGRQKVIFVDLIYYMKLIQFFLKKIYCLFSLWGTWIGWWCENPIKLCTKCVHVCFLRSSKGLIHCYISWYLKVPTKLELYSGREDLHSLCPQVTLSVGFYHPKKVKNSPLRKHGVLGLWLKNIRLKPIVINSFHSVLNLRLVTGI